MKWPRISVGAIMAALVVIAINCVVFRSIWTRPVAAGSLILIVSTTLPMVNLLAVGAALLARRRAASRPFLLGFEVGGWSALVATAFGIEAALNLLEVVLERTGLLASLTASPILEEILGFGIILGLPLLFQILVGLGCGGIARKMATRQGPAPAVEPGPNRLPARSYLVLVVLVAIPAIVVEAILRSRVDPATVRLVEGTEAVITLDGSRVLPQLFPPNSPLPRLVGTKVRIESDREPNLIEMIQMDGSPEIIRGCRSVRIKLLDGETAGESVEVPHYMLRPDPPRSRREIAAKGSPGP